MNRYERDLLHHEIIYNFVGFGFGVIVAKHNEMYNGGAIEFCESDIDSIIKGLQDLKLAINNQSILK